MSTSPYWSMPCPTHPPPPFPVNGRLSRADKSSESSPTKSESTPSPVANIGCALCQQKQSGSGEPFPLNRKKRASSEETLKRSDSRRLTIPRGGPAAASSSSTSSAASQPGCASSVDNPIHRPPLAPSTTTTTTVVLQQLQQQYVEVDRFNATTTPVGLAAKSCACEECMLACRREQLQQFQQQQHHEQQLMAGPSGTSGGAIGGRHSTAGGVCAGPSSLSIAMANAQLGASGGGPTTSSSGGGTSIAGGGAGMQPFVYCNGPPPLSTTTQTIEEQIKQIDRITKECDNSRKSLEQINRRLDDLNDEVRRYREFLGHEKARRDPTLYKTNTAEPLSPYNDGICRLIDSLTTQLTMEWTEKLRSIQNQTIAKSAEKG